MKKTVFLLILVMLGTLFIFGCTDTEKDYKVNKYPIKDKEKETEANTELETIPKETDDKPIEEEFFIWLAYWNYAGYEEEVRCFSEKNMAVSVFGVLFDQNGDVPFLTPETEELLQKVMSEKKKQEEVYLSFINDLRLADGTYSNKDVELLRRLFAEAEGREKHVAEIVDMAAASGVDGIEIDYENIKKDETLWEPFCLFLELLKEKCKEKGLLLRVVLGAYDVDKAAFPEGIEYAVMCYNLYGTHSGPGPKADVAFLKETFLRCENLPGKVSAAFSTGGFVWADGTYEKAVTELEARELYVSLGEAAGELLRDEASGALHFSYTQDEVVREVWFADGETLLLWKNTAKDCGINQFSLWKAGGNGKSSLLTFVQ